MTINPIDYSVLCLLIPPLGLFAAIAAALIKPAIGLGKTAISRLSNPKRDIFGRHKRPGTPDPIQEGLGKTITVASRNIQDSTQRSTSAIMSNIGLGPKPISKSNIALIVAAAVVILVLTKR